MGVEGSDQRRTLAWTTRVSRTGDAIAGSGYANSGMHVGDVTLSKAAPAHSRYLDHVREIAPARLVDREEVLAEFAEFCSASNPDPRRSYVWWRAEAWAGKSALMSWFVLHPPPGVRIVSFFITSRMAGQSDREAFLESVLEQLAAMLGEPIPAAGGLHLPGMLREAAEACRNRDERLVLVVDGLDEDRGVTTDADFHSIAALLPGRPPAGMRIIVTGRPNPPVPSDVRDDHPLRDPTIVRSLSPSRVARTVRSDMERELKRLVAGTQVEHDLLGLLTAARGGLSAADLQQLTELLMWRVDEQLHSVAGRSFASRPSYWRPSIRPNVYLLAHEELQAKAMEFLGDEINDYRARLHDWADRYRNAKWPSNTPEYLLRGYFRMLADTDDVDRMITYATDTVRHDRMLDLSGGDATASAEINMTLQIVVGSSDVDFTALARLALHRGHLAWQNANVPVRLPAVWARLGHSTRAETLALSIPDPERRVMALVGVVEQLTGRGEISRAYGLAATAESMAAGISPWTRNSPLAQLSRAVAALGDVTWAARLASSNNYGVSHLDRFSGDLPTSFGAAGDDAESAQLINEIRASGQDDERIEVMLAKVKNLASSFREPERSARLLTDLAMTMDEIGNRTVALDLAEQVERALKIPKHCPSVAVVAQLVDLRVAAGQFDRAQTLIDQTDLALRLIPDEWSRALAFVDLVSVAARCGDADLVQARAVKALDEANLLTSPRRQSLALARLT